VRESIYRHSGRISVSDLGALATMYLTLFTLLEGGLRAG
jgi:hypothetical protein